MFIPVQISQVTIKVKKFHYIHLIRGQIVRGQIVRGKGSDSQRMMTLHGLWSTDYIKACQCKKLRQTGLQGVPLIYS